MTRQEKIAALAAALKPLAEKWLYPDDIGMDEMFEAEEWDDSRPEEVWVTRGQIRAAREALKLAGF